MCACASGRCLYTGVRGTDGRKDANEEGHVQYGKNRAMSVLDDPIDYSNHTLFQKKEFGDFTAFYITISICTILGAFLFLLNIVLCCCSRYKDYWKDTNTGNLWLVSIWTKPPNLQVPLDLTELEACPVAVEQYRHEADYVDAPGGGYLELQKRESDL